MGGLAKFCNVFPPGDGERHGVRQLFDEEIGRQRRSLVQSTIESCHDRLFDLRPAEAVARADDLRQIEFL